jgi:hypothetical protein
VFIRTHHEAHWGCQSIGNPVTAVVMRADSSRGLPTPPPQARHLFILTTCTHPQGGILAYGPSSSDWEQAASRLLVTHCQSSVTLHPGLIMPARHLQKFPVTRRVRTQFLILYYNNFMYRASSDNHIHAHRFVC